MDRQVNSPFPKSQRQKLEQIDIPCNFQYSFHFKLSNTTHTHTHILFLSISKRGRGDEQQLLSSSDTIFFEDKKNRFSVYELIIVILQYLITPVSVSYSGIVISEKDAFSLLFLSYRFLTLKKKLTEMVTALFHFFFCRYG